MFCKECGAEIPEDSKHCKECGVKLDDSAPKKQETNMKAYGLILGVIGGLISFICISTTSMLILSQTAVIFGIILSFVSVYGAYSMYKEQRYGKFIFVGSIVLLFFCGREYNLLGVLVLIVSYVLFYVSGD